ncbi:MAG: hypothetical protein IPH37_20170 [Burkholderiales bacterium]|nr:hypothetical protein [Burkholderiales bacterium]
MTAMPHNDTAPQKPAKKSAKTTLQKASGKAAAAAPTNVAQAITMVDAAPAGRATRIETPTARLDRVLHAAGAPLTGVFFL